MAEIVIDVHVCATWIDGILYDGHTYRATFATDVQAVEFIARKTGVAFFPVDEDAMPDSVLNALDPACEHGLSLRLCMGPNHYPTNEQEMAMTIL